MRDNAVSEESVDPMACAIEELVGNYEIQGLVLFFQRSDCGHGDNPLDPQLFEAVNVGAEIEFAGQDAVAASVPCEEGHFAAFESTANVDVRGSAKWRLQAHFLGFAQARHRIEAATANDAYFCLGQISSAIHCRNKLVIIQERLNAAEHGCVGRTRRPPQHDTILL
jgi:hypothetical protein